MVCRENICRSPMAEGLLRHHLRGAGLARKVVVDSAGTRTSWPGRRADPRAQRVADTAGIQLGRIKAVLITDQHLQRYDYVFAMDQSNIDDIEAIYPGQAGDKLNLLLSPLPEQVPEDVPDPYYDSLQRFNEVFELIDQGTQRLIPILEADLARQ